MKKHFNKLLATFLAITLVITAITVPTSVKAVTVEYDNGIYHATGLSDTQINALDAISVTDKQMLDDVIERSYHNDFQTKRYIIKTKDTTLDTSYWDNYIHALGDAYLSIDRTISDRAITTDEYSYFSVNIKPHPANAPFDTTFRSMDRWDEYDIKIKEIENNIGILNPNLCDYQKIQLAYMWIKDNVEYGTIADNYNSMTGGSDAIEAVLEGRAICSGYSRIFNRFMHDCNIDSYWMGSKIKDHAYNIVKFDNKYHSVDTQVGTLYAPEGYENKNHKQLWLMDGGPGLITEDELNKFDDYLAIIHYDTTFEYCPYADGEHCFILSCPLGTRPEYTDNTDGTRTFLKEGEIDKECDYCHKVHEFKLPVATNYDTNDVISHTTYPYCESQPVTNIEKSHDGITTRTYPDGTTITETWSPLKTAHSFTIDAETGIGVVVACENCGYHLIDEDSVNPIEPTTPEVTTPETITPETTTVPETTTTESTTVPETSSDVVTDKPTESPTSELVTTKDPIETTNVPVVTTSQPTTTEPVVTTTKPIVTTKAPETTTKPVVTTKPTITKIATPSKVKPKATNIKTKSIKLTWKKTKNAKKYQIQYSTDKKFKKKVKTKTVSALKYTIKKLTKKKTYYVRVRGVNGVKYGKWSSVKKVKIKK